MFGAEFGWENYDFKSKNSTGVTPVSIFNPIVTPSVGTLAIDRYTETRTYAGYLMDRIELTPQWKLLAGVRNDVFSAAQDDRLSAANDFGRIDHQWNPRAGIVWQPTKTQSYYFSYGTSFNPSAEAYSLSEATNTLPPEKNRNFEIGAKYDLVRRQARRDRRAVPARRIQCPHRVADPFRFDCVVRRTAHRRFRTRSGRGDIAASGLVDDLCLPGRRSNPVEFDLGRHGQRPSEILARDDTGQRAAIQRRDMAQLSSDRRLGI